LDNIKICISCKSSIWSRFLFVNDTKTHTYDELLKFHDAVPELDNKPGFLLKDFLGEEIEDIIPLYQAAFGFKGEISKSLLFELRNGFFLRIFSEVYSNKQVPEKISDLELIKKYIKQSFEKTKIDFQSGIRTLSEIGKTLINHRFSRWEIYKDEGLEIGNLLKKLNFSLDQTLPNDLFARNILVKYKNKESYSVAFYYSKIRDYIICYYAYTLDKLSDQEFYDVLELFYKNHIGQSAISFYFENASHSHLNMFKEFKKNKALSYVNKYDSYLNHNFKRFKEEFNPYTKGKIGIMLPLDSIKKDGYALFPLDESTNKKVLNECFDNLSSYKHPFYKKEAKKFSGSNQLLMIPNQTQLVTNGILKQLNKIVEKGKLNEYSSDILLIEKVATILYFFHRKLNYNFTIEYFELPRFNFIYPIDLRKLRDSIYIFRANYYYRRIELEKQKHYAGNVNRKHYYYFGNVDKNLIDQKVEKAFKMKLEIPKLNVIGDFPPFEELTKIVGILLKRGYSKLENHYLPCPDIDSSKAKSKVYSILEKKKNYHPQEVRWDQFSDRQAKNYIRIFFTYLEAAYKDVVECCFPTFKEEFEFYKDLPHEYFFYIHKSLGHERCHYGYRASKDGKIKVNFKDSNSIKDTDDIDVMGILSFDDLIHVDKPLKTVHKINTRKVDKYCVIRNWLYKLLRQDVKKIIRENTDEDILFPGVMYLLNRSYCTYYLHTLIIFVEYDLT